MSVCNTIFPFCTIVNVVVLSYQEILPGRQCRMYPAHQTQDRQSGPHKKPHQGAQPGTSLHKANPRPRPLRKLSDQRLNLYFSLQLTLDKVLVEALDRFRNFTRFDQFYVNLGWKARAGTPACFDIFSKFKIRDPEVV